MYCHCYRVSHRYLLQNYYKSPQGIWHLSWFLSLYCSQFVVDCELTVPRPGQHRLVAVARSPGQDVNTLIASQRPGFRALRATVKTWPQLLIELQQNRSSIESIYLCIWQAIARSVSFFIQKDVNYCIHIYIWWLDVTQTRKLSCEMLAQCWGE